MDKVTLQIPMSKSLRIKAEKTALEQGFSSLQELIRVFLKKMADGGVNLVIQKRNPLSVKIKNSLS